MMNRPKFVDADYVFVRTDTEEFPPTCCHCHSERSLARLDNSHGKACGNIFNPVFFCEECYSIYAVVDYGELVEIMYVSLEDDCEWVVTDA